MLAAVLLQLAYSLSPELLQCCDSHIATTAAAIAAAVGYVRKILPVHITSGFGSTCGPHNPAGCALLQGGQQQAGQVCMPKKVCSNLTLHTTSIKTRASVDRCEQQQNVLVLSAALQLHSNHVLKQDQCNVGVYFLKTTSKPSSVIWSSTIHTAALFASKCNGSFFLWKAVTKLLTDLYHSTGVKFMVGT